MANGNRRFLPKTDWKYKNGRNEMYRICRAFTLEERNFVNHEIIKKKFFIKNVLIDLSELHGY